MELTKPPKEYSREELESMTDAELRELQIQDRMSMLTSFIILLEYRRRAHEVEWHGREGSVDEYRDLIGESWKHIGEYLRSI